MLSFNNRIWNPISETIRNCADEENSNQMTKGLLFGLIFTEMLL